MTKNGSLDAWSFDTDDERALTKHTENLYKIAHECVKIPVEETALKACGATRHVWDAAEGMVHADLSIDSKLLSRAIEGIGLCINAVSGMRLPPLAAPALSKHRQEMISAMAERRDDLLILLGQGKVAFKRRLKTGSPTMA